MKRLIVPLLCTLLLSACHSTTEPAPPTVEPTQPTQGAVCSAVHSTFSTAFDFRFDGFRTGEESDRQQVAEAALSKFIDQISAHTGESVRSFSNLTFDNAPWDVAERPAERFAYRHEGTLYGLDFAFDFLCDSCPSTASTPDPHRYDGLLLLIDDGADGYRVTNCLVDHPDGITVTLRTPPGAVYNNPQTAAEALAAQFLDTLCLYETGRSFRLLDYRNPEVWVTIEPYGTQLPEGCWCVGFTAEMNWEGHLSPAGPTTTGEFQPIAVRERLMVQDESGYILCPPPGTWAEPLAGVNN